MEPSEEGEEGRGRGANGKLPDLQSGDEGSTPSGLTLEELRRQVDEAIMDPDLVITTRCFDIDWEKLKEKTDAKSE